MSYDEYRRRTTDSLTDRDAGRIEGFAAACDMILRRTCQQTMCDKSYDPMEVDLADGVMWSYAFNMEDGGRRHEISDYKTLFDIFLVLTEETSHSLEMHFLDAGADTGKVFLDRRDWVSFANFHKPQ